MSALFGETGNVTAVQECARAVLVLAYGLAILRLAGRRIFGRWSALDIIVSIVVGSNLSRALTGNAPLFGTIAATTVLIGLHWLLARLAAHYRPLSRISRGPLDRARPRWRDRSPEDLSQCGVRSRSQRGFAAGRDRRSGPHGQDHARAERQDHRLEGSIVTAPSAHTAQ